MPESKPPSAIAIMAERMNLDPPKLTKALKDSVFKNASDDELLALVVIANEHKLNPFTKEIYAFPSRGGGIVPIISVDGWITIMNNHPKFDGIRWDTAHDNDLNPVHCACTIFVKGRSQPVMVTEFFNECKQNTEPWKKYPYRMLRWQAMKQAARVAFGLSNIASDYETEGGTELAPEPKDAKPVFENPEEVKAVELFEEDAPPGAEMKPEEVEA